MNACTPLSIPSSSRYARRLLGIHDHLAASLALLLALGCGDNAKQPSALDAGSTPEPGNIDASPATDMPPYGDLALFVRGSFNDWGTSLRFTYVGNGQYLSAARLPVGQHLFKIADEGWSESTTFSVNAQSAVNIELDANTPLVSAPGQGNHTNLVIPQEGVYRFLLSAQATSLNTPSLVITYDEPPYDVELYLRGSFNDWGSPGNELLFVYQGDHRYQVTINLSVGVHQLKVADAGWSDTTTFSISADSEEALVLDMPTPLTLATGLGNNTLLTIDEAGAYTFVLTATEDLAAPELLVRMAEDGEVVTVNPHEGAILTATLPGLPGSGHEAVISIAKDSAARTYALSTTQPLRLANAPSYIYVDELADAMTVRTGNLMFDGLFALALAETRQNQVDRVTDGSFMNVDCDCFETGEQWHFVWTRDISYSVDLALAMIDPARAKSSLLFKTSGKREALTNSRVAQGPEIVQDTGSGGSWPVSTDRVVWAMAAWELLKYLDGAERTGFLASAYEIVTNTIATDRQAIYDSGDGLYRGEQSFLDWREQTYPSWVASDVVHIAMAKSLSTNVGHHAILRIAADMAGELGQSAAEAEYRQMAEDLAAAINQVFWQPEASLYRSLKHTELDAAVLDKYDLLGAALAVITGVASADQADAILAAYPHGPAGPPVVWPQLPEVPIYHNRAVWPFVTAYALRAAKVAGNSAALNHNIEALMRGAALNLSNMENLEFLTGSPAFFDPMRPQLFGPVLNSRRQLWSVAGYLSMVLDIVFGREATQDGIRFQPFITRHLRSTIFAGSQALVLRNLNYRQRRIDVRVELPPADDAMTGAYAVAAVTLNGELLGPGDFVTADMLSASETNTIVITLGAGNMSADRVTLVGPVDPTNIAEPAVYAPVEPELVAVKRMGPKATLTMGRRGASGTYFRVYRNGVLVADDQTATTWEDPGPLNGAITYCYAVEQVYERSGHASHHSPPMCLEAALNTFSADWQLVSPDGAPTVSGGGITYYADWGEPGQELHVNSFMPPQTGDFLVSASYRNNLANMTTGVTATVKWLDIVNVSSGITVASGVLVMPQIPAPGFGESSYVRVRLEAGVSYRLVMRDFFNMSYLDFFSIYNGAGGSSGPNNRADITAIYIQQMRP